MAETYGKKGGTPWLDGQYTVFGEVTIGLDVVKAIQSVSTDTSDRPLKDVFPSQGNGGGVNKARKGAFSQRSFALARIIVCCGASIVAHFARKVRARTRSEHDQRSRT